jgi:hypothetical protein
MSTEEQAMSTEDQALLAALRRMWEVADPPPADLATRTLFLLELDNLEVELMSLRQELSAAGARNAETASTITFASESLTVMLTVSPSGPQRHRLDGWLAPGAALRLELRTAAGVREDLADSDGRFVFTDVPPGLVQLVIHPTEGAAVRLVRSVVTPATNL